MISGKEVIKALNKIGFYKTRQRGDHVILRKDEPKKTVVPVPHHNTLAPGTLLSIIKKTNLTKEELVKEATFCQGCQINGETCIPIGIRIENKFCDINKELKPQLEEGMYCDNNYECDSNVCVSSKCISTSFLEKIIEWFKKIFG